MDERPLEMTLEPESATLRVSGTVDELSAPPLRQALQKHSEDYTRDLVVDLDDVDFLPSLGVGVLAVAMRHAEEHGVAIRLRATEGTIAQRVLHICGLPHTKG